MRELFYFIVVAITIVIGYDYYKHEKECGEVNTNFLKEVTINNETHVIVDYVFIQRSYVLDNGVTIDRQVIEKLLGDNYGK